MKAKTGKCMDCGAAIRRDSKRCRPCYEIDFEATRKRYFCERCGGQRSRTAAKHCMQCSKEVAREEFLAECDYTLEEYDFVRQFHGYSHEQALDYLIKGLNSPLTEIKRRLELARRAKEVAA